jgi:hypothetical protein
LSARLERGYHQEGVVAADPAGRLGAAEAAACQGLPWAAVVALPWWTGMGSETHYDLSHLPFVLCRGVQRAQPQEHATPTAVGCPQRRLVAAGRCAAVAAARPCSGQSEFSTCSHREHARHVGLIGDDEQGPPEGQNVEIG